MGGGGGGGIIYSQEPFGAHSTKFGIKRLSKLVIHKVLPTYSSDMYTNIQDAQR